MRTRYLPALCVLSALVALQAEAVGPPPPPGLALLQGRWRLISLVRSGDRIAATEPVDEEVGMEIRGAKMSHFSARVIHLSVGRGKAAHHIDFARESANGTGPHVSATPRGRGVFKVDNDRLTICVREAKFGRPPDLTGERKHDYTFTFERVRP